MSTIKLLSPSKNEYSKIEVLAILDSLIQLNKTTFFKVDASESTAATLGCTVNDIKAHNIFLQGKDEGYSECQKSFNDAIAEKVKNIMTK